MQWGRIINTYLILSEKLTLNGARMKKIALKGEKIALWKFGKVYKHNGYVFELMFYDSTQIELSHAELQLAWVNSRRKYRTWFKSRKGTIVKSVGSEQYLLWEEQFSIENGSKSKQNFIHSTCQLSQILNPSTLFLSLSS